MKDRALPRALDPGRKMALIAAALMCLAFGCDDGAKRPLQARVPALAPASIDPPTASDVRGAQGNSEISPGGHALPLTNPLARPTLSLLAEIPGGKAYLVQRVEERFASGEQNYTAGHLE